MVAQPLRLGGLAVAYALATATLVLLTVVASNLVLSVVAGLGAGATASAAGDPATVEGVLLSADQRPETAGCHRKRDRGAEPREERRRIDGRCGDRRNDAPERRP